MDDATRGAHLAELMEFSLTELEKLVAGAVREYADPPPYLVLVAIHLRRLRTVQQLAREGRILTDETITTKGN